MSSFIRKINLRIRRRETPFYDRLYELAKTVRSFSFPVWRPLHSMLYLEWCARTNLWHNFWRIVYYEPMFKSQCVSVGKKFRMEYAGNGCAKIFGDLRVSLGSNVCIFDNTQFVGLKVFDSPELVVGDNTYLGPAVLFYVGKRISVGSYCMITSKIITDNPGHPIDNVLGRMQSGGGSPIAESIRPITIGDFCFLPLETVIYPGVTIGDGVVARIGTHINRDVPPFCQVEGNPMRIKKKLPIPSELAIVVGEERFKSYFESQKNVSI